MNEGSISAERLIRPLPAAIILCIILVAVFQSAGCLNNLSPENKTENSILTNTPTTSTIVQNYSSPTATPVLSSDNYWIKSDPFGTAYKNNIAVSGTTNLPEGSPLLVSIDSWPAHATPSVYDYSHEDLSVETSVIWVNSTGRGFSTVINVSELNLGNYQLGVNSERNYSIYSNGVYFNLLPAQSPANLNRTNYIYANCPSLPPLYVNGSMEPILITGNAEVVSPDSITRSNQIPYGSIMLFSADGIDRIFNANGTQIASWYDSNQVHLWQIPSGTRVQEAGNITTMYLDGNKILTKIYETEPCG
jgi:hypothetical protein